MITSWIIVLLMTIGIKAYPPREKIHFPLRYIDHSINIHCCDTEKVLLPTGKCEDINERDLSVIIPGEAPCNIYPGFIESTRVTCLSISDSLIEHLAVGSFDALPNLLYLDLSRNRIEFCDLLTFGSHDRLITLVIDENNSPIETTNLVLAQSHYFPSLKNLYLRKNSLHDITVSLRTNFPSLTHLYLSDNQLQDYTFDYLQLPNTLTHLHLERNWIRRVNSRELINLRSLALDGNRLQSICSWQCHNSPNHLSLRGYRRLQFLTVSNNEITTIDCDSFEDARYLKSLNLAHNSITDILSGTFDVLRELRDLSLSYNQLMILPDFQNIPLLTSLSLDHNFFDCLPVRAFADLYHLKWLSLGGNRIRTIATDAFVNLPSLEELDLSKNELSYLPYDWLRSTCLRHLDIRGNRFKAIDDLSLNNVVTLTHLYLQGNPLSQTVNSPSIYWRLGHNVSVFLEYDSSIQRAPCYVQCDRVYREYTIPRVNYIDEWTW